MPVRTRDSDLLATRLADGAVALMHTDTLPGLHARADHAEAVSRIRAIKGRADDKPLLLLCDSTVTALALAASLGSEASAYIETCWPGPFTLILPAGADAPPASTRGGPTVALRVPQPPGLRAMIAAAGGALVSTSVNRSGEAPLTDLTDALGLCGEDVDIVGEMTWRNGPGRTFTGASCLLDLTVWPPHVVRPGSRVPPRW